MENFCKLSVDGLKFVNLIVKMACFVEEKEWIEEDTMQFGRGKDQTMIQGRSRSFFYQKRTCSSSGQLQDTAIAGS
jgi:hypothetical protein